MDVELFWNEDHAALISSNYGAVFWNLGYSISYPDDDEDYDNKECYMIIYWGGNYNFY